MEAIILAGGLGTRLRSVVADVPKCMVRVVGRPFLEYVMDELVNQHIGRVILSVGYMKEAIREHFENSYSGIDIDYAIEETPLGTGGGILLAMKKVHGPNAIVLNGDTLFEVNLDEMQAFHKKTKADTTLALRKMDNTQRYGNVSAGPDHRITGFAEKSLSPREGYINGGTYLVNKDFLLNLPLPEKFSFEKDFFEVYYQKCLLYGFPSEAYFIDIGIPEDYERAEKELKRSVD
ncbi:MAG: nucleotidyltransferase family protein [Bacteroidetes bacterium]|nr:nucleotidyltransferase family protein [Bacteroidota bacterium]